MSDLSYESKIPSDYTDQNIIKLVEKFNYKISVEKIKFLHHGTYNVYEINDEFIFRFPDRTISSGKAIRMLTREKEILDLMKSKLLLPVPDPIYISNNSQPTFVGYKKIPGIALSKCYNTIPQNQIIMLAKSIGVFLSILHSNNILTSYQETFPNNSKFTGKKLKDKWINNLELLKTKVFSELSSSQQVHINELITNFINNSKNFSFKPCITHMDFDTSNILVNENTYELMAIIDFEDCGIGDPAYDFQFIDEGKEFLTTILEKYSLPRDEMMKNRIIFYYQRGGIPYILYGIKHNKKGMVDFGKKILEKRKKIPYLDF